MKLRSEQMRALVTSFEKAHGEDCVTYQEAPYIEVSQQSAHLGYGWNVRCACGLEAVVDDEVTWAHRDHKPKRQPLVVERSDKELCERLEAELSKATTTLIDIIGMERFRQRPELAPGVTWREWLRGAVKAQVEELRGERNARRAMEQSPLRRGQAGRIWYGGNEE